MTEAEMSLGHESQNNEKVLWSGLPVNVWAHLRPTISAFVICLAVVAMPTAILASFFGYVDVPMEGFPNNGGLLSILFLLPFFFFGFGAVLSPVRAFITMKNTLYAVSDRRLIIISKFFRNRVQSWSFDALNGLSRRDASGGVGDVIFASEWVSDSEGGKSEKTYGFLGIENARNVETIIMDAIRTLVIEPFK